MTACGWIMRKPAQGTPVIFVHEYAGDWRSVGAADAGFFSRPYRCMTYSQRGYPPSDIPEDGRGYGQESSAMISSRSWTRSRSTGRMSSAIQWAPRRRCTSESNTPTAACRWPRPVAAGLDARANRREARRRSPRETGKMFAGEAIAAAAAKYGDGPSVRRKSTRTRAAMRNSSRMLASIVQRPRVDDENSSEAADAVGHRRRS